MLSVCLGGSFEKVKQVPPVCHKTTRQKSKGSRWKSMCYSLVKLRYNLFVINLYHNNSLLICIIILSYKMQKLYDTNIKLIEGRHKVVMNGDFSLLNSNGNLFVQDVQENKIFDVPICKNTLKFFNLQVSEESAIDHNILSNTDMVFKNETTVSTACWKDDNEVKCLIHLWNNHQKHFKTMKSQDVWTIISNKLKEANPE
ncbi:uncharacterized protein LOC109863111 [Pseudomyrmex gracilis]|uniref:uncharacterized protein LOC109863111 n=1 Tax=Pseudomyrmex gracilis TaxID=219809 RepID=UPI00099517B4|nr:uncharacterized protein LOC109863111 [Pseudomyrmex gracilis]